MSKKIERGITTFQTHGEANSRRQRKCEDLVFNDPNITLKHKLGDG